MKVNLTPFDSMPEAVAQDWDGRFKHPALGRNERYERYKMEYHRPLDLLRQRLLPAADVLPFPLEKCVRG